MESSEEDIKKLMAMLQRISDVTARCYELRDGVAINKVMIKMKQHGAVLMDLMDVLNACSKATAQVSDGEGVMMVKA